MPHRRNRPVDRGVCRACRTRRRAVYACILGQELTEVPKQQFIIDNRPGAGAVIGTDIVARSAPDG